MELLFCALGGLSLGSFISWLITKLYYAKKQGISLDEVNNNYIKKDFYEALNQSVTVKDKEIKNATIQVATLENEVKNLNEKLNSQKEEMEKMHEKLTTEFQNIANHVLKTTSEELSTKNQEKLSDILKPLDDNIQKFKDRIEAIHNEETKDKSALKTQIENLAKLNEQMSQDANNLTNALKYDSKQQGNWGEIVLERILENAGLIKDEEYKTQDSVEGINGESFRPDVVVYLPENKHIIVDSKVSLTAYERMCSANDENEKKQYLKDHIASIKKHVDELSVKNYQDSKGLNSPDFVLMFLPIEGSFMSAIQEDNTIYAYGFDRKVVIVSPTTLLVTLRTVASIWKQEKQNKNFQEIARLGGALYDKIAGFIEDMESIKKNIDNTNTAYEKAMNKLSTGKGCALSTARNLEKLGAKTTKKITEIS